ncbi:cytochrome b/b6 domain-containing protein [Ramlibacter rhizophilus]|uniref:Cytochrome B n=1 Tax=Ramlibacter rhizophilus TaxID=1781167 RepID=A0A4Z0BDQ6_9BURK|nr:cytochrome b/b6 domain-containing protein [Ramlibacter rhizophilus]TFY97412.1 cytochrome B [Ramlibacter rhizophilus]
MSQLVRVWDLPTRVFHWALVACLAGLFITGYQGGAAMLWHARFGYAVLSLLLFRLLWGFVGGRWSRFSAFVRSPRTVLAYLRGQRHPDHLVGHNPLGALAILAMVIALLAQVATGLVGDDEIAFTGPLNRFVASAQGLAATSWHKNVGQWLVVGLVALHLAAILFYTLGRKQTLVRPMLTGDKPVATPVPASRDDAATRTLAALLLGACGGAVAWLVSLGH